MNSRSPEEKTKIADETKRVENKLIPYDEFVGEVNDEEMFGPNVIRDNDKNLFHCRFCKRVLFSSAQFLKHVHRHKGIYHIFSLNFLSFYFILKDNCNTWYHFLRRQDTICESKTSHIQKKLYYYYNANGEKNDSAISLQ